VLRCGGSFHVKRDPFRKGTRSVFPGIGWSKLGLFRDMHRSVEVTLLIGEDAASGIESIPDAASLVGCSLHCR